MGYTERYPDWKVMHADSNHCFLFSLSYNIRSCLFSFACLSCCLTCLLSWVCFCRVPTLEKQKKKTKAEYASTKRSIVSSATDTTNALKHPTGKERERERRQTKAFNCNLRRRERGRERETGDCDKRGVYKKAK